nr:YraN family protein [uncultured Dethiosulfovibrio sp.]
MKFCDWPEHLKKGVQGEELACDYISSLRWTILARNVRFKRGELDIIAKDGDELVVVEVRYRSVGLVMPPEASVGPVKLRKLVLAGSAYVDRIGWDGFWRIDLIAITDLNGKLSLEHLRDITGGDVSV